MTALEEFAATLPYALDEFQVDACTAVEDGRGVLVAAPTGAGKTVVGEFAVELALRTGRKAFYTTPIKALSNQKYHDLVARHGAERVGLLTGDVSIRGEAPVVVMTTEVLRNMVYAGSATLAGLGFVVMDEVHYLADKFRGAVWEEVIIHLPESVQVVSLSATVSNAEEFGDWLTQVRGNTAVVVSEHRPVPLWQHLLVGDTLFDLFAGDSGQVIGGDRGPVRINPEVIAAIRRQQTRPRDGREFRRGGGQDRVRGRGRDAAGGSGRTVGERPARASRADIARSLDRDGLLPAITFIFSRAGCDGAVKSLLGAGVRLIPERDGQRNRRVLEERVGQLSDAELDILGYWDVADGLDRGFAAHHAGMLPLFREVVEELFTAGRIRAVYATETLALGINMPARTVVLEKLVKFNGEAHVDVTPAEYTQLTGRAGRRGIDVEGHAVVQWSPGLDPGVVGGLASTRTYPLRSSFAPTYNMAVNLVARLGRERAREVLETSFAQFQADRGVVGLARAIRRNEEALAGYADSVACDRGDFWEYAALRRSLADAEKAGARARGASRRAEAALSLEALRVGDVFRIGAGRRAGWAVVVSPARSYQGEWSGPTVVTADKHLHRVTLGDAPAPVEAVARIKVPAQVNPKNPQARRDLATSVRIAVPHGGPPPEPAHGSAEATADGPAQEHIARLRRDLKTHPCHRCPDREDHARWAERWWRLTRETEGLRRKVESRTNTVARTFDRICATLAETGDLSPDGTHVTPQGERLRRIYTEKDLLAAHCLRAGVWRRLDPASLAACVSALIHEPRGEGPDVDLRVPSDEVATALGRMHDLWADLGAIEERHGVTPTAPPDGGLAWAMHRWASGRGLDEVLRGRVPRRDRHRDRGADRAPTPERAELTAGDFVRRCKQVIDLLGQLADAADDIETRRTARRAIDAIRRGVVADSR